MGSRHSLSVAGRPRRDAFVASRRPRCSARGTCAVCEPHGPGRPNGARGAVPRARSGARPRQTWPHSAGPVVRSEGVTGVTRTVIIGAGVAGLATAALLAREGHEVTVLEKNDRVGGRAGLIERDGFRFDTGPSWYLMPEVFEHFFALLGTSVAEQLELTLLDPAYRVFGQPSLSGEIPEPLTVPRGREKVAALFEAREPGSKAKLERYLDSASRTAK